MYEGAECKFSLFIFCFQRRVLSWSSMAGIWIKPKANTSYVSIGSDTLQTLLRALRTLCFSGLIFGKLSTVMIFFPWILRLLYSASAVEHYKLLSYDLCFPLSCSYFGFKNSPVKMKLS